MSVGSKIRYIRNLRGLTQKELGMKAGFSATTADVRIRQYESNKMIPKTDKLKAIADALNVDISALANIDFSSQEELIHTLFDLEREHGLCIKKQDSKYILYFDEEHPEGTYLKYALDAWYNARQRLLPGSNDESDYERKKAYEIWTQRYPLDLYEAENSQRKLVQDAYAARCAELKEQDYKITQVNQILLLFEKMIKIGIDIEIESDKLRNGVGILIARVSFIHSQLLELDGDAANLFAKFLCMIEYLKKIEIGIDQLTHSFDNATYSDYLFHSSMISSMILEVIRPMRDAIHAGVFEETTYKMNYEDDIRIFNVPIKDAL